MFIKIGKALLWVCRHVLAVSHPPSEVGFMDAADFFTIVYNFTSPYEVLEQVQYSTRHTYNRAVVVSTIHK